MIELENGNIVTMKLISGEEMICKYISEDDGTYSISKPVVLIQTAQGPGLIPYVLTAKDDSQIDINKNVVVCVTVSDAEIESQYIENTTNIKIFRG